MYMIRLFKGALLAQEVQCLKAIGLVVVVLDGL